MGEPPRTIYELAERFQRNRSALTSEKYNEAQLRQEFINPVFRELGWDVDNAQGLSESFKEVIHEDSIEVEGRSKAPDYCFRVGGARVFFLEAKKPAVDIDRDPAPAFQLRRYSWSSKLPLGILTNFAQFAMYDCRVKPVQTDRPSKARVFFISHDQYAEHWEFLASILSKDAVLKGGYEKFAQSSLSQRGTEEVGGSFLEDIENWRLLLARNIALRNRGLTQPELNWAVQALIDRIVFLRIGEDRGLEPYRQLHGIASGARVYPGLCDLFKKADYKYNSGLFHFEHERGRREALDTISLDLSIDDTPLRTVICGLYYPESPYEFSVFPPDILGQVYEQFLGKVIRLTPGHQAKVEDKPQVKKAGGVFYTPSFVVDYIVRNTVGPLLRDRNPSQAKRIRIIDPTCGSGSFLLGAYRFLLNWHQGWYETHNPGHHSKQVYRTRSGEWRLTLSERKDILLRSLYGVDVDSQAVEVTKLSLLLAVLENETDESLQRQHMLFHIDRVLPDLGMNIRCGNTLIGSDFGAQGELFEGVGWTPDVSPFDWIDEFPDILGKGKRGFDVVIGNPPWGADFTQNELEYLRSKHKRVIERMIDSYIYFLDKALSLVAQSGYVGFIIPATLLNQTDAKGARTLYLKRGIANLVNLGKGIFGGTVLNTSCILISGPLHGGGKLQQADVSDVSVAGKAEAVNSRPHTTSHRTWRRLVERDPQHTFFTGDLRLPSLLAGLRAKHPALKDVIEGEIQRGVTPDIASAHVLDKKTAKGLCLESALLRPSLSGSQIKKFSPWRSDRVLIYTTRDTDLTKYPNVRAHLTQFKQQITCPEVRDGKHPWWALHRPRDPAIFESPKFIGLTTTTSVELIFDESKGMYVTDAMYVFRPRQSVDPWTLLAVMQSRVFEALYLVANQGEGRVIPQVKAAKLQEIPIPSCVIEVTDTRLRRIVERIEALNGEVRRERITSRVESLRRQIESSRGSLEHAVADLYGLTEDNWSRITDYLATRT